jgi:mRNA deadenylase 3'-5' endonuclease subunit Ccr4
VSRRFHFSHGRDCYSNGVRSFVVRNMRGLNSARHDVVRELVASKKPSVIGLQETKMNSISDFDVSQFLDAGFDYVYLPCSRAVKIGGSPRTMARRRMGRSHRSLRNSGSSVIHTRPLAASR